MGSVLSVSKGDAAVHLRERFAFILCGCKDYTGKKPARAYRGQFATKFVANRD
jgi:hypothetical protein